MAPKFVEVCQKNNLAVIGFEGFLYDSKEETVEPLSDQIADFSAVEASSWEEFRNLCNKYCKNLIRRLPPQDELVVNFTVLSQVKWLNKRMTSDQTTGEVGKPMEQNQRLEI